MTVLFVPGGALQAGQNVFKTRVVSAIDSNEPEGFDKGGEQGGCFRSLLLVQSFHGPAAQVFRQLIGPKRFDNRRHFIETSGDGAPRGRVGMFDAACIIQNDVASLAARSVSAGVGELAECMAQRRNRYAPDIR